MHESAVSMKGPLMAKRYHQSFKDRLDEHRAEERAMHRKAKVVLGDEYYAGQDPRRRQEMQDAGMINEDHHAIANLPQGVKMTYWPKGGHYIPQQLDDTIRGINDQMDRDGMQMRKHFRPEKI